MKKYTLSAALLVLTVLLSGCSDTTAGAIPSTPGTTSTRTTTEMAPAVPSPESFPVATTGSYEADLAALGVVPDNIQSFSAWMNDQICAQTGAALGVSVRSIGGNETGGGVEGVRLAVAYFCPEKSPEVESYLEYFAK